MQYEHRQRLIDIMARLAAGDGSAVLMLHAEFGGPIRAALAAIARQRGRRMSAADLDDLVTDACFALRRLAGAWRPEGALPWTWAKGRLGHLIDEFAPPAHVPLELDQIDVPERPTMWTEPDPSPEVVLDRLAARHASAGVVAEAIERALSPGERAVLLRYALQRAAGDPSPSHTVAAELGLGAPAVRQRASRARRKLLNLARTDPRYRTLATTALVTDSGSRRAA